MTQKIGRYDIRAKLADGGMAHVFVGRLSGPAGFEKLAAIKVIKPEFSRDKEFTNMFLDEARIAARLSHPNIVQVYELGEDDAEGGAKATPFAEAGGAQARGASAPRTQRLYLAMELLFGESLWDIWFTARAKNTKLPDDIVAWIGARIADGLHHAHELTTAGVKQNVIHRDINPSNIFVTYDGQPKIIDFGLAKAKNRVTETGLGVIKGKVAYMAPEQTRSGAGIDRRIDIFALGITLWELTADRRLFKRADNVSTLAAVDECKVPDPTTFVDGYPAGLWAVLKKALAKNRDARYATAQEMSAALDEVSRAGGRIVTAATVASFMDELFGAQRQRYQEWLDEIRADKPASPEESFRGPTSVDDNAILVGVPEAKESKRSEPPPAKPESKRPDPFLQTPEPETPAEQLKESRRAWVWGLLFLVLASGTYWWVVHRM